MAQKISQRSRERQTKFLNFTEWASAWSMQLALPVFLLSTAYLLWGIFSGQLPKLGSLTWEEYERITYAMQFGTKILVASGVLFVAGTALRYHSDELTGYGLFAGGILLRWGVGFALNTTIQTTDLWGGGAISYIIEKFASIGTVAMVAAVPFIAADFWYKLIGIRRDIPGAIAVTKDNASQAPNVTRFRLSCWQTPYCREYLRKRCRAYMQKKPCWRIKSGCYCDEEMLLAAMKQDPTATAPSLDPKFTPFKNQQSNQLSPAQRRERCRQCFIYNDHQRIKYQLVSPLVFPAVVSLIWVFNTPIRAMLDRGLTYLDQFAKHMAFLPKEEVAGRIAGTQITASAADWIFLGCIGLIAATYLLKGLEYLIFELQV